MTEGPTSPQKPNKRRILPEEWASLLAGLRPGWYMTHMLYPRYEVWAANEGKLKISRQAFGLYLAGYVRRENTELTGDGTRRYLLTEEYVSGEPLSARPVG